MSERGPMREVIFEREEGFFYFLELPVSDDLAAHAKCNPGTVRVTDIFGNVLWPPPEGNTRISAMHEEE